MHFVEPQLFFGKRFDFFPVGLALGAGLLSEFRQERLNCGRRISHLGNERDFGVVLKSQQQRFFAAVFE